MFECGDVVAYQSPTAGKRKFHLCVGAGQAGVVLLFLHINSGSGYAGDCVFPDGEIEGLPQSPTNETIVSFSQVIRMPIERLGVFQPEKVGVISQDTARTLTAFARATSVLSGKERRMLIQAFDERWPT